MEKNKKDLDNIELRSEKVRNVIGKVPPRLVSLGTVIITVIVLAPRCRILQNTLSYIHRD